MQFLKNEDDNNHKQQSMKRPWNGQKGKARRFSFVIPKKKKRDNIQKPKKIKKPLKIRFRSF